MMISQNEKKLMKLRLTLLLIFAVLATVYFQCAGTAEAATNNPGIIPPYTGGTAPSTPVPAAPQVPNALNEILSEFRSSFNAWLPKIGVLLWWTFLSLSTISWVLKMAQVALSDQLSLGAALHHTVTFLLFVFFFKWVFANGASLAMLIPDSMGKLANAVTGYNFSPDGVFDSAVEMASKIFAAASQLSWVEKLFGYLCAAVISLFLFGIAAIFIMIYVENIIVILCGFVLLVFAAFSYTRDYAYTYLRTLIAAGMKMFICGIIGGILGKFIVKVPSYIDFSAPDALLGGVAILLGIVFTFWILVSNIPNYSAAIMSGGVPSNGLGTMVMAAGAMMALGKDVKESVSSMKQAIAGMSASGGTPTANFGQPDRGAGRSTSGEQASNPQPDDTGRG